MTKSNFIKSLPPWAKGVVAVAVIGGVAYAVYALTKNAKDAEKNKGSRQEDSNWNKEFDQLNSNPSTKATLSKAQMLSLASALQTAMDGYGTDFEAIVRVFQQIKNDADFAGVTAAYGIREISSGRLNPEPNFKGTLSGALTSELGANITGLGYLVPYYGAYQIAATDSQAQVINKILAKNKIKYKI